MKDMDFMAIGAHPDDVEIFCGGTILKLVSEGKQGVIVDLTDGAAGTRGDVKTRYQESQKASKVLGIKERINLGLTDSAVENNRPSQLALINVIRKYRPKVIISHWENDEHPDHRAACHLVRDACYLSGLAKLVAKDSGIDTDKSYKTNKHAGSNNSISPFRPSRIFYFPGNGSTAPSFCVDISAYWKKKMQSILCYESQFFGKGVKKFTGKTALATPEFLESLELRFKYFGQKIKRVYAEPFICEELPEIHDITNLGNKKF